MSWKSSMNENIPTCERGTNSKPINTKNTVYGKFIFLLKIYARLETNNKNKIDKVCVIKLTSSIDEDKNDKILSEY